MNRILTFFYPLPPHLVHVAIEWPLNLCLCYVWITPTAWQLHGDVQMRSKPNTDARLRHFGRTVPNQKICYQSYKGSETKMLSWANLLLLPLILFEGGIFLANWLIQWLRFIVNLIHLVRNTADFYWSKLWWFVFFWTSVAVLMEVSIDEERTCCRFFISETKRHID